MLVAVIASFVIALLSGLGVGGGGLFVVFLNLFTELPQLTVQGINLLFFIFSSGSAVCIHLTKRRIFASAVIIMIIFGVVGAVLGMFLARYIGESLLRKAFGSMLVLSGILALKRKNKAEPQRRGVNGSAENE